MYHKNSSDEKKNSSDIISEDENILGAVGMRPHKMEET